MGIDEPIANIHRLPHSEIALPGADANAFSHDFVVQDEGLDSTARAQPVPCALYRPVRNNGGR